MKLESQFFYYFFSPFLIGVGFCLIIVIISSIIFTNDYIDKITGNNVAKLGKEYSNININAVQDEISSALLKMQAGFNELILLYLNLANKLKSNEPNNLNRIIDDNYLICSLDLNESHNVNNIQTNYMAYWLIDLETNLAKLKPNSFEESQLIVVSNMMKNIYSIFYSADYSGAIIYFYFDSTELFISFPLNYDLKSGYLLSDSSDNSAWCTDQNGDVYNYYKAKCGGFYNNIKKAKSDVFDINYKDNENRTIFVTEYYIQSGMETEIIYTICIEFTDPFSNQIVYLCSDLSANVINYSFENINSKLNGYFFINTVGFSQLFYFPNNPEEALTVTENIFSNGKTFFLEEKTYFTNYIQKLMSSNYIKYINNSIYSEIFVNGKNSNDQIFYLNGEKFQFSIYPVVLDNYKGIREHVLNIIYIYNDNLFYNEIKINNNIISNIVLELIIIIIFISGSLYLIFISLNTLAKHIVIPIKNVNYMLKGINIGGINRLEYLNYLKKKQDDNIEKLQKMTFEESEKNDKNEKSSDNKKEENNKKNEDSNLTDENKEKNNINNIDNNKENNNEMGNYNNKNNYKNIEEENDFIEKESTFYNFDEQLLQYRPLEIDYLIKELIDLKGALSITANNQQVEQIINYSNSEEIFRCIKNKEGTDICQSNIGNLHIQLLKYDKAIYHLSISLQDKKLKRFLSKTLTDEFDENDTLFNKIFMSFHQIIFKNNNNILIEKQQNDSKNNFSHKMIGVLINSRYNKLIYVYYKFFSLMQKQKIKDLIGLFANTTFHNINYYHKIIIQYIYLSFVKNDFIKIGESILDYIEFLIKFKFKNLLEMNIS